MSTRYATKVVRDNLARNVNDMESTIANPVAWDHVQKKGEFKQNLDKSKRRLGEITPPDVKSDERPAIESRLKLIEDAIVKGAKMPSYREMWENNAGDTGKHISWEKTCKKHTVDPGGNLVPVDPRQGQRGLIDEWKDLRRTLHKEREEDDPDVANVEILRPRMSALPLADQKSPRSYGLSYAAKMNYDQVFADRDPTPVEAVIMAGKEAAGDICGKIARRTGKPCKSPAGKCRWHQEQPKEE